MKQAQSIDVQNILQESWRTQLPRYLFQGDKFFPPIVDDFGLVDLAVSTLSDLRDDVEIVDASLPPRQAGMLQTTLHQLLGLELVVAITPRTAAALRSMRTRRADSDKDY